MKTLQNKRGKVEVIKAIAKNLEISSNTVNAVIMEFLDIIGYVKKNGGSMLLRGKLSVKQITRKERNYLNPKTLEKITAPAKVDVSIKYKG